MNIQFFPDSNAFHQWLAENHSIVPELWVGYYRKESGKQSITYPESVDEALCFGWIDGIRKKLDDESYTARFTPRRPESLWSPFNIKRVQELLALGRMQPAGLSAYDVRKEKIFGEFSYANRSEELAEPYASVFKQHEIAWQYYLSQPPSYRKEVNWRVVCAKKEETRMKRLEELITCCNEARMIPAMQKLKKSR